MCREQAERIQQLGNTDQLVQSILAEASNITPGRPHNFTAFRMNWFRVEASLSSVSSVVFIDTVKPFVSKFNNIIRHSYYADEDLVKYLIEDYLSWKPLWYFANLVQEEFNKAINPGFSFFFYIKIGILLFTVKKLK